MTKNLRTPRIDRLVKNGAPLGPTVLQPWMTAGDDIAPWVVGTQCGARIIVNFKATDGDTSLIRNRNGRR